MSVSDAMALGTMPTIVLQPAIARIQYNARAAMEKGIGLHNAPLLTHTSKATTTTREVGGTRAHGKAEAVGANREKGTAKAKATAKEKAKAKVCSR